MSNSIESLLATGTKLWLDSIDPELGSLESGRGRHRRHFQSDHRGRPDRHGTVRCRTRSVGAGRTRTTARSPGRLTDLLVRDAQQVFLPVWQATRGDDGYVSFELDPLLEDPS